MSDQGRHEAAIDCFKQALSINPIHFEVLTNLGKALHIQGDLQAAIAYFKQVLSQRPDHPDTQWSLANTQLLLGDYKDGWVNYESRFRINERVGCHAQPESTRLETIQAPLGEEIPVVSEQGIGDNLQFMRYVLYLKKLEFNTSFCVSPKPHPLIASSGITQALYTPEQANAKTDGRWIPLLSLPRVLDIRPDNVLINEPYIKSQPDAVKKWQILIHA